MAHLWIAGAPREVAHSAPSLAPWNGEELGRVGIADGAHAGEAITSAQKAFAHTSRMPAHRRRDLLRAISDGIVAQRQRLADLLCREACKPITLSLAEVDRAAQTFALGAEESTRQHGEVLALDHTPASDGMAGIVRRVPIGPVLAITPFNFPLNLVAHKLAPAFAVGAPVVLKPAPQTPLIAFALAEIIREAGAPEGLLSVLPAPLEISQQLVDDPRLPVVSFTGSAAVGWRLRERAYKKKVLLELGGNAAAIVCPDADLDHALDRITAGAFGYAGQVCIKVQRVYAHSSVYTAVTESLAKRARSLRVLDPTLPACVCSALIDERSARRVRTWCDQAISLGAQVMAGGEREGNRLRPAVITGAVEGMMLYDEEVFGPVLTVNPYDSLDECIAEINVSRYGLQAGIFTHDLRAVATAFRGLDVGALVVNDAPTVRVDAMPYGGVKDSGSGREGVRYAIDEMTDRRMLLTRNVLI